MIPKKIHLIWLGSPLPEKFKQLVSRIKEINFDYEIKEWTDDNIEFELTNQQLFDSTTNMGSKSDILRMEILYRYGGIYMDHDFYQCKKFDDLLRYEFVVGSKYDSEIWNGLIMSTKENVICETYIKDIQHNVANVGDIMNTTGPFKLKNIFDTNTFNINYKVLIGDYFYPFDLHQRFKIKDITLDDIEYIKTFQQNNTYCIHLHSCSWQ
jgi:mannosyltransferase OCH1-like enzyme